MSRKDDLEASIHKSYQLINEYEAILRESESPRAKANAMGGIEELRVLIEKHKAELDALTQDAESGRPPPPEAALSEPEKEDKVRGGQTPPVSKKPPYWAIWGLASLAATSGVWLPFLHKLRYLLDYRITEAHVALVVGLVGAMGAVLLTLLTGDAKRILLGVLGGMVASLLLGVMVVILLPPLPVGESEPTPTFTSARAATPTFTPTITPTSTPTTTPAATGTPTGTPTATHTPTGTPTATRTPTGTPTATATIAASSTPAQPTETPTATMTATLAATSTATPRWLDAPVLIAPEQGASFTGWNAQVILQWSNVGSLRADEYYVVRIPYDSAGGVAEFWRKDTTFKVPSNYSGSNVGFADRHYNWTVQVMRCIGNCDRVLADEVKKDGTKVGGESQIGTFYWHPDVGGSGPEPR